MAGSVRKAPKMLPRLILAPIRFLAKADTHGLDPEVCWEWQGPINPNGYGRFVVQNKHVLAHRWAYAAFVGPIPNGQNVCHACDNRRCVNPHHLWLGTQSENLRDAVAKGRMKPPALRGEANRNRKLDADTVRKIRAMHEGGFPRYRIAAHFGVAPSTIGSIISGQTWKEVA